MEKITMNAITKVINLAVDKAVERALFAGTLEWEKSTKDIYKQTEARLWAYPILLDKLEDDKERLAELESDGMREHSKSVVARHNRSGSRLSQDEILGALIQDRKASVAATQHEIDTMESALKKIKDHAYYRVISGRFIEGMTDEEIAEEIPCDPSTVRRNRGTLIRKLSILLYGAEAILGERPSQFRR